MEMKDFLVGMEMTTPQIVFYLWNWQGEMTLITLYNQLVYDKQFIEGFLKRITTSLFTELVTT